MINYAKTADAGTAEISLLYLIRWVQESQTEITQSERLVVDKQQIINHLEEILHFKNDHIKELENKLKKEEQNHAMS